MILIIAVYPFQLLMLGKLSDFKGLLLCLVQKLGSVSMTTMEVVLSVGLEKGLCRGPAFKWHCPGACETLSRRGRIAQMPVKEAYLRKLS